MICDSSCDEYFCQEQSLEPSAISKLGAGYRVQNNSLLYLIPCSLYGQLIAKNHIQFQPFPCALHLVPFALRLYENSWIGPLK